MKLLINILVVKIILTIFSLDNFILVIILFIQQGDQIINLKMIYMSIYPRFNILDNDQKNEDLLTQTEMVRFPEQLHLVYASDRAHYGNLYVGNYEAALNLQLLKKNKINCILSVAKGYQVGFPREEIRHNKYIPLEDSSYEDYYRQICDSIEYIEEKLLITNVIVHCVSGLNRSAWISTAFLIKSKGKSLEVALDTIKKQVKLMTTNKDILQILKKYEIDLQNKSPRKNKYNNSLRAKQDTNFQLSKQYFTQDNVYESVLNEINQTKCLDITQVANRSNIQTQILNRSTVKEQRKSCSLYVQNPEKNYSFQTNKLKPNQLTLKGKTQKSQATFQKSNNQKTKKEMTLKTIIKLQTNEQLNSTLKELKCQLQKRYIRKVNNPMRNYE